ncbi:Hint domain-containing protein [Roseomonas sp. BN140053]|uniref:Hint domain-containing protein n=1 Tax=Roseomonas sp. BN140053 TaxID=3391898 RepID=UPI0039E8C392
MTSYSWQPVSPTGEGAWFDEANWQPTGVPNNQSFSFDGATFLRGGTLTDTAGSGDPTSTLRVLVDTPDPVRFAGGLSMRNGSFDVAPGSSVQVTSAALVDVDLRVNAARLVLGEAGGGPHSISATSKADVSIISVVGGAPVAGLSQGIFVAGDLNLRFGYATLSVTGPNATFGSADSGPMGNITASSAFPVVIAAQDSNIVLGGFAGTSPDSSPGVELGGASSLTLEKPAAFAGTIYGFTPDDRLVVDAHVTDLSYADHVLTLRDGETTVGTLRFEGNYTAADFSLATVDDDSTRILASECYVRGTRIATPDGERAVESLSAGDTVLRADGIPATLRWVGHRQLHPNHHPTPQDVCPIRIRAHALGPRLPARDLLVSPGHHLFLDGALVPARALLDGALVVQDAPETVEYWHLELAAADGSATHGVLLAEGLPAESFLDTGRSGFFADDPAPELHALPPEADALAEAAWATRGCAPRLTGGGRLRAIRRRIARQAAGLGFRPVRPALRLLAGARELPLTLSDGWYRASLPEAAPKLRLCATASVPADDATAGSDDLRLLGARVAELRLRGADGTLRPVALDDPRLCRGWHAAEPGGRWTDGDAELPDALWAGLAAPAVLELRLAALRPGLRAPAQERRSAA